MAAVYGAAFAFMQLFSDTRNSTLSWSGFRDYRHWETCTFIGKSGVHLQWTTNMDDTYATPNMFSYLMLSIPLWYAKPFKLIAGPIVLSELLFFWQSWRLGGSFEAASVWCWSAMLILSYYCAYPYVFPLSTRLVSVPDHDNDDIENSSSLLEVPIYCNVKGNTRNINIVSDAVSVGSTSSTASSERQMNTTKL
jgi:hypothetical protein